MEATLLIPYNYSDPAHDFDLGRNLSLEEYNKEMLSKYRTYKPIIDRNWHRLGHNLAINNEGAKEKVNFKQQGTYMAETIVNIRNMRNGEISIDELLNYYQSGEMFILDLQLPEYDKSEELEPEIKSWIRETKKLNNSNLTDEERLVGYTKRDLKIKFKDSVSSALLMNTKMVDIVNNHTFAFLVEKIIFLKN